MLIAALTALVLALVQGRPAAPAESSTPAAGASRIGNRFVNISPTPKRPGFRVMAGIWLRKIWTSLVPRSGAAERVPFDRAAAIAGTSLTWIGRSAFLVRMDGIAFLTDPMFSDRASPLSFAGPGRLVAPGVPLDSLPDVDFALLSHDHYDHADEASVRELSRRGVTFVVPLGMKSWVEELGGEAIELDWWGSVAIAGVTVHCVPAQHFSGRGFGDRGLRLWAGWVVVGPTRRFYHAGDTGYSPDLAAIGDSFGPLDLAAVPVGAYRPAQLMSYVHTTPEQGLRLGLDVGAQRIVAMHWGTFDMADEPLDEPPARFLAEAERRALAPDRAWVMKIGETRAW